MCYCMLMQHDDAAERQHNHAQYPWAACPDELQTRPQWVLWRMVKGTKVPFDARTHRAADYTDPDAWSTFADACAAFHAKPGRYAGVGYVFSPDDPYTGIDLDKCVVDGEIVVPEAAALVARLDTYTEISPSGTGVKLWVRGSIPKGFNRLLAGISRIEMYDRVRFFTVTGRHYPGTPLHIRDAQDELAAVYETYQSAEQRNAERGTQNPEPGTEEMLCLPNSPEWERKRRYALAALQSERQRMLAAVEGHRHDTRLAAAYALAGYCPYITEQEITDALAVNFGPNVRNAMKTIADGIKAGRAAPRTIRLRPLDAPKTARHAAPQEPSDADRTLSYEEITAELARVRRENAALEQKYEYLDAERRWRLAVLALPTATLSPAAKVVAQILKIELDFRKSHDISGLQPIWIEDLAKKVGLSAGVFGTKVQELEEVGAIRRVLVPDPKTGHSRVKIEALLFDEPERWERDTPRNHGGDRKPAEDATSAVPVCDTCTPGTPVATVKTTTQVCEGCGTILDQKQSTVRGRRPHRPNPQFDGLKETEDTPQPRKLPVGPVPDAPPPPPSRDPRSMIARVRPRKHPPP
jgi:hypothetical protein